MRKYLLIAMAFAVAVTPTGVAAEPELAEEGGVVVTVTPVRPYQPGDLVWSTTPPTAQSVGRSPRAASASRRQAISALTSTRTRTPTTPTSGSGAAPRPDSRSTGTSSGPTTRPWQAAPRRAARASRPLPRTSSTGRCRTGAVRRRRGTSATTCCSRARTTASSLASRAGPQLPAVRKKRCGRCCRPHRLI